MLNKTSKFSRKTRNALSFARPYMSYKERLHVANEIWAIFISLPKFFPKEMKRSDLVNALNALSRTLPPLPLVPLSLSLCLSLFHPSSFLFDCTPLHWDLSSQTRHQISTSCTESTVLIIGPGTHALIPFATLHSRWSAGRSVSETRVT